MPQMVHGRRRLVLDGSHDHRLAGLGAVLCASLAVGLVCIPASADAAAPPSPARPSAASTPGLPAPKPVADEPSQSSAHRVLSPSQPRFPQASSDAVTLPPP